MALALPVDLQGGLGDAQTNQQNNANASTLTLAGTSTAFLYGVAFTLRGGVGTASAILGRDLFREFHQGQVLVDRSALPVHDADWDPFQACRGHSRFADTASRPEVAAA